jgi:AcrR family transcriptional regulator
MAAEQRASESRLLLVAEELLTREGPQGLSVRRIADALGTSRQIVYTCFRDKPDLVRALHEEGFRRLTERFAAVPGPRGTTEHVLEMGRAYRASALASPALYSLMFGRPILEFEPDARARDVAVASFRPVIAGARALLSSHELDASDAAALDLARKVWSVTHGVVSLELAGLLGSEAEAMIDQLLRATLDSIE